VSSDQKQPDRPARKPVYFRPPDNFEEMTEEEQIAWAEGVARAMIAASPNPFGRGPEPAPDPEPTP
jgi:hypothetical protein